jgi:uncharacterized protein
VFLALNFIDSTAFGVKPMYTPIFFPPFFHLRFAISQLISTFAARFEKQLNAMNPFVAYSIPVQGLNLGAHEFKFSVDSAFFALFEDSPIATGQVDFEVFLEKRSDMLLFDFEFSGHVGAVCDRCTAEINLPIEDSRSLIAKYTEDDVDEEEEVVFIHREAAHFNLAQYLYEFVILALPINNVYDCQDEPNPPCNFEVLEHLGHEDAEEDKTSIWDELKNLKDN